MPLAARVEPTGQAGDGLGAGGGAGIAALLVQLLSAAGLLEGSGPVGVGEGGAGGVFPQRRGGLLPVRCVCVGELGGRSVAGGGQPGCAARAGQLGRVPFWS
jgi:hypothetical protein